MIPFQSFFVGKFVKGLLMAFNLAGLGTEPIKMKEQLMKHDIVPKLFPKAPLYPISIEYQHGKVEFGNNFTESQVLEVPSKVYWPVEKKLRRARTRFVLLMYGPDVPTRQDPLGNYQWQHWLIVNIPGNKWKEGHVLTEYRAWQPFYTNDVHRCIFLVFKQKARTPIKFNETFVSVSADDKMRGFFNTNDFIKKYNLGEPYAINFFEMHLNGSADGNIWRAV